MNARTRKRTERLETLFSFDAQQLEQVNQEHHLALTGLIGVDEVGRGSLIGPVVAAAYCFPGTTPVSFDYHALLELDDSKAAHFTHAKRLYLAESLKSIGYWGVGEASKEEVERFNVSKASLLASYRAIENLFIQFVECPAEKTAVVLDGKWTIAGLLLQQVAVVKADQKSAAVAAASVIAKAYRDSMMIELAKQYPQYQWEANMGYPTPGHQAAMDNHGITPLHRTTYKSVQERLGLTSTLLNV